MKKKPLTQEKLKELKILLIDLVKNRCSTTGSICRDCIWHNQRDNFKLGGSCGRIVIRELFDIDGNDYPPLNSDAGEESFSMIKSIIEHIYKCGCNFPCDEGCIFKTEHSKANCQVTLIHMLIIEVEDVFNSR